MINQYTYIYDRYRILKLAVKPFQLNLMDILVIITNERKNVSFLKI